jgi:hypothetical protein
MDDAEVDAERAAWANNPEADADAWLKAQGKGWGDVLTDAQLQHQKRNEVLAGDIASQVVAHADADSDLNEREIEDSVLSQSVAESRMPHLAPLTTIWPGDGEGLRTPEQEKARLRMKAVRARKRGAA